MNVRNLYQAGAVLLLAYASSAFAGAPANDPFASATVVPFAPGITTVGGTNVSATRESGEPFITGNGGGSSVWWRWTPTSDGLAIVNTFGSSFDTLLGVYTGSPVNSLTLVQDGENDDSFDDDFFFQSQVFITVTGGVTYQIVVDGYDGDSGSVTLNINFVQPPANDDFDDSILIPGTVTVTGTNVGATLEVDDPVIFSPFGGGGGAETVWWHWVADVTGNVEFSLSGSSFDTVLGVYTGSSLATLVEEGSNDDFYGLQSSVTVAVTTGTTYRICVTGYTGVEQETGDQGSISLSVIAPLSNDNFAGTALGSGDLTTNGTNNGATLEVGEPTPFSPGTVTVWWNWTAPGDGTLEVDTFGSSFDTILGIYTGSAVNALTEIGSNDDSGFTFQSQVTVPVLNGVIYNIQVNGFGGDTGAITLNVDFTAAPPRPANDDFVNSIALGSGSVSTTGVNVGGTPQSGEPNEANVTTVWWNWTATTSIPVEINTFGSNFDTVLGIYTGGSHNVLTEIDFNDDDGSLQSRVNIDAVAGQIYQIQISGFEGDAGDITLNVIEAQPPVNDDFANRIALPSGSSTSTGTNLYASAEPAEYTVNGDGGVSVWWDWTAPVDGDVVIDTIGSDFDSMIAVYVSAGFPFAPDLVVEADNGFSETVTFAATGGTTYHIQIDGFGLEQGNITLNVTFTVPPPNDDYADAIDLGTGTTSTTGTNVNATDEPGEISVGGNGGASVWWTWTATQKGSVEVNTFGSDFDTMIIVYTGNTLPTLADAVAFNDEAGQEAVSFTAVAGTTYHIQIDGFAQDQGSIALAVIFTPPPANDDFVNAIVLSGGNTSGSGVNSGATFETGEPFISSPFGGGSGTKSVWWVWTAPGTPRHQIEINTFGSDFDTMLGVYTGTTVDGLTLVADNDDDGINAPQSSVLFDAAGGTTYYILVNGYDDGSGADDGNVTVNIVFNQDPVANTGSFSTNEDATLSGTLSGSDADNDELTYTIETNGTLGTVTITDDVTGEFEYVPSPNASGTDGFTFRVYDGVSFSSPVTGTVIVTAVADAPTVNVADANGPEGSAVLLPLSVTLGDADGSETLTIVVSDILPGITLNHGTEGPAGVWTLTAADLAGLAANIPDNVDFFATVTATSTETSNSDAAVTSTQIHIAAFNVEPTIALSGTQTNGGYQPYILTFGAITDPGTDTVTEYIVHWGDGATENFTIPFPTSVSHSYAAVTVSPLIVVDLIDEDGLHLACGTLQAPDFGDDVFLVNATVGDSFFFDFVASAGLIGTPTPVITVENAELPAPLTGIGDVGLSISGTTLTSAALLRAGELTATFRATNSGGTKLVTLVIKVKHTSGGSNTPQIKSAPTATPNPAQVGIPVAFSSVATDADGDLLSYFWDFGDGSVSHANRKLNTTHVYTQPGTYRCTLNVEDDKHLAFQHFTVVIVEAASNSNYLIQKFKLTFDFRNPTRSQLVIVGSVPIPAGQPVAGVTANVQIPGSLYSQDFVLNSKFTGGDTASLFSLKVTAPGATQNIAKFTLHLKSTAGTDPLHPSLFQMLTPLGYTTELIGKPGKPVVMPLVIRCPNTDAGSQNDINTVYTTVKGKTGKAVLSK